MQNPQSDYDYIIIGSGFGGSVSALRLSEKGYKVLVIEKGKWWKDEDFPKSNWQLKKWLWAPRLGLRGIMKMSFLKHVTVLSGVGVGGGSLTYANTLPVPKKAFFTSGTWKELADWEEELAPFYKMAYRMLGVAKNPKPGPADVALQKLSEQIGRSEHYDTVNVGVYFGEPGQTVSDPYFGGHGPDRTGCIHCGECMTGCRHNAKNTLDKNYLHLARKIGAEIIAEHEVTNVRPLKSKNGEDGYVITCKSSSGKKSFISGGVIFSGGVMGTIPLLLKIRKHSLPLLSDKLGCNVSTNNEALTGVTTQNVSEDYSKGLAIGSILHTDENSHLEPVRYGAKSGFFKLLFVPLAYGNNMIIRTGKMLYRIMISPISFLKILIAPGYSTKTVILLFMQTLNSTLRFKRGKFIPIRTEMEKGPGPSAFLPESKALAEKFGKIINGNAFVGFTETLMGIPSTAHILGGAVMGANKTEGVINSNNEVFGYRNMLICDGSMISSNPGVNPSLTITAISERAMSKIPLKSKPGMSQDRSDVNV